MSSPVIQTTDLTKRFGKNVAVDSLSLAVPEGTVFGFLGRNGAGKTTTIKMLLGLLPRTSGSASVLGLDSARKSLDIKRQVGYVPEQHHLYRWMTVDQLMWFCKAFYPTWDDAECARLLERFKLPGDKKIRQLSRGMIAKTALTLALAHDPKILVLDEPTGGLDVIVRREFLESIVRLIQERGKTVFISSHLLADVERVADQVAIIDRGALVAQESLESLKSRVKRVRLRYDGPAPDEIQVEGLLRSSRDKQEWIVSVSNFGPDSERQVLQQTGAASLEVVDLDLEGIFVEFLHDSLEDGDLADFGQ